MYIYDPNKNKKDEKANNFYFSNISGNEIFSLESILKDFNQLFTSIKDNSSITKPPEIKNENIQLKDKNIKVTNIVNTQINTVNIIQNTYQSKIYYQNQYY